MTTAGHILPGYVDYPEDRPSYSRRDFRRVKTAYVGRPILSEEDKRRFTAPVDSATLDEIRQSAKNLWLSEKKESTTYNTHYRDDLIRGQTPARNRPSSPTRRNKPHPEPLFLTCRLHYVPGYHNPDTTVGRDPYVPDGLTGVEERWAREQARAKYTARPTTGAIHQYRQRYQGLENLPSREAYATEAWLNIVNDEDKEKLLEELKMIPYRQERAAIPMVPRSPQFPDSSRHVCFEQRPKTSKPRLIYQPIPKRGDYLLHPEWPPTLPRHKLPCMC